MNVRSILDHYIAQHIDAAASDTERPRQACAAVNAFMGGTPHGAINNALINRYCKHRAEGSPGVRPVKPGTYRYELVILQAALRFAQNTGLITEVPKFRLPAAPKPKVDYLTKEQVKATLDALQERDAGGRMSRLYRFFVLAVATGARKSAIEFLRWGQIDLRRKVICYSDQVSVQTRKRRVDTPIPDWVMPYLQRALVEKDSDYFLDHPGCIRSSWRNAMPDLARRSGVSALLTIRRHTLRHTCATLLLAEGATLWQVAGVLGDNVTTVAKVYGHHAMDDLANAVNKLTF